MDRETILRRAAKLMQFQSGNATQAELELAAARLGELMREHNISLGDITAEQLKDSITQEKASSPSEKRAPAWYQNLSRWVAFACSCRSIKYGARYEFLGEKSDAAVAVYFMGVCSTAIPFLCDLYKPTDRKAFLWAAVEAVGRRLCAMVRPPDMSVQERGLIVNKDAALERAIVARYANRNGVVKYQGIRVNRGHDAVSYAQGTEAGNNMRLNHGVTHANAGPGVTHSAS